MTRKRDYIAFDPAKYPALHRRISCLGGIAAQAKRTPEERRRLAALGGRATEGISKNQGEDHARACLTEVDVIDIRTSGATPPELAAEYGCTRQCIDSVRSRRTWKHI